MEAKTHLWMSDVNPAATCGFANDGDPVYAEQAFARVCLGRPEAVCPVCKRMARMLKVKLEDGIIATVRRDERLHHHFTVEITVLGLTRAPIDVRAFDHEEAARKAERFYLR